MIRCCFATTKVSEWLSTSQSYDLLFTSRLLLLSELKFNFSFSNISILNPLGFTKRKGKGINCVSFWKISIRSTRQLIESSICYMAFRTLSNFYIFLITALNYEGYVDPNFQKLLLMNFQFVFCNFYIALKHQNWHLDRPLRVEVSLNRTRNWFVKDFYF